MEISTSTRPMTSKFGKQVHPEELTQRSLIKQVLETSSCEFQKHMSTIRLAMVIKLSMMITYLNGLLLKKLYDPFST